MLKRLLATGAISLLSVGGWWLGTDYARLRAEAAKLPKVERELREVRDWLSEPVLTAQGKTYSRAQLLDLVLKVALDGNTQNTQRRSP